jgi:HK97 family phage prohead protease
MIAIKSADRFQHFDVTCDLKFADTQSDTSLGTVTGYASVFGILDRGGDIVMPGAFKASLADWKKRGASLPMLWQHDPSNPIGVWTQLDEDEKGLKVEGELIPDVPQAAVTRSLMKHGAVTGLSMGYQTKYAEVDRSTGARRLKKVDLWEISLVTFPMLPEAQAQVKNIDFDPSFWEKAFRDEGLSNREAKLATSVARKLTLRDAGRSEPAPRDGAADVLMALRKTAESLRI